MTKLSYKVGERIFPSSQYAEAAAEATKQGTIIKRIYNEIDETPKADPVRMAKLKMARQKKIIGVGRA